MVMATQPAIPSESSVVIPASPDAAFLRGGRGKQREEESDGKRQHGDAEIAPAGAVAPAPHASDDGILRRHRRTKRNARGIEDFAEDRFGLLGFFLRGDVARADDDAVREDGNDEPLEIVRQAIIAAFEKRARLRGAMKHHGAARADAQAQLLGMCACARRFRARSRAGSRPPSPARRSPAFAATSAASITATIWSARPAAE